MMIPDFDDIVFEGLNKEYGAYLLRKKYSRIVSISILIAGLLGCLVVCIPFYLYSMHKNKEVYSTRYVTMENMMPPGEQLNVPEIPAAPANPGAEATVRFSSREVRYVAPVVVDSILPAERTEFLTADSLAGDIPGQGNINGSGNGTGISSGGEGDGLGGGGGNGLYSVVDVMPTFKGGDVEKFREWIRKKTRYPETATINGIQGRVYITFIVEKDGSVSNVKVARGVDPLIDDEAFKAVSSSPKWTPGKRRGVAVRVSYFIMLNFQL